MRYPAPASPSSAQQAAMAARVRPMACVAWRVPTRKQLPGASARGMTAASRPASLRALSRRPCDAPGAQPASSPSAFVSADEPSTSGVEGEAAPSDGKGPKAAATSRRARPTLGWERGFYENYALDDMLGHGSFGKVLRAQDRTTGDRVAVKIMPKHRPNVAPATVLRKIGNEAEIFVRLQMNQHVVKMFGLYEEEDEAFIVQELCEGGDLGRLLQERKQLPEKDCATIMFHILQILADCHSNGICYADVKPTNFLLKNPMPRFHHPWLTTQPKYDVKAVDFGCSQFLEAPGAKLHKRVGTPVYMSPQVYDRCYGVEADVWSAGVMLYQLLTNEFPFWPTMEEVEAQSLESVEHAVRVAPMRTRTEAWTRISAEGRDLLMAMLERDEMRRISAFSALCHPFFEQQGLIDLPDDMRSSPLQPAPPPDFVLRGDGEFDAPGARQDGVVVGGVAASNPKVQAILARNAKMANQVDARDGDVYNGSMLHERDPYP